MRSVRFGNLIICKHVFDNFAERYPYHGNFDFNNRDERITVARLIKARIQSSILVHKPDGQAIYVNLGEEAAYPAEIGPTITKIVTSYPAGQSLVNKAKLLQDQCQDQCQIPKINHSARVVAR